MSNPHSISISIDFSRALLQLAWQPDVPQPAREGASPWVLLIPVLILVGGFVLVCVLGHYFVVRPRDRATKTRRTDRERTLDSLNFRPLKWTPTTTDELRDAFGNFRGVRRRIDLWKQTQLVNAQIQSGDQRRILVFDVIRDDDELDATGTESTFVWIVDPRLPI